MGPNRPKRRFPARAVLGAAFILTADSVSYADLATQVSETAQIEVSNTTSFINTGDSSENIQFYLFWYHTLGWLWTHQLVMAVTMTSIAGGVSFWYFAGDDRNSNPKVKFAFFRACPGPPGAVKRPSRFS
jgi:hypothetical protein